MKTTIEISDSLLAAAKRQSARERTTLRALVEAGLRSILKVRRRRSHSQLRDASFAGDGLSAEFKGADRERIREAAYESRGG